MMLEKKLLTPVKIKKHPPYILYFLSILFVHFLISRRLSRIVEFTHPFWVLLRLKLNLKWQTSQWILLTALLGWIFKAVFIKFALLAKIVFHCRNRKIFLLFSCLNFKFSSNVKSAYMGRIYVMHIQIQICLGWSKNKIKYRRYLLVNVHCVLKCFHFPQLKIQNMLNIKLGSICFVPQNQNTMCLNKTNVTIGLVVLFQFELGYVQL